MKNTVKLVYALLLLASSVQAATVVGNMLDIFGNAAGTSVRFVPSGPLAIGTNTYLDYPRSARITNGLFSVWLAGGFYDADFVPYTLKPIRVLVWPSDTNTYTFNHVATLAVNAAMFNGSNLTVNAYSASAQSASNALTALKLVEPDYVGGSNTFEPVYTKTQGTNLFIRGNTNSAADGLYTVQTNWVDGEATAYLYTNANADVIFSTEVDFDRVYAFTNAAGQTNFTAGVIIPTYNAATSNTLSGGLCGTALFSWTTNYTFGGWGVNGQTPTDGAVLAFGDGLDYTTNGSIWTIFSTNIPAPSLGTTNPPAADKVLTLDSNTNLYWATPAAGGGEVTIGTNTIPTDKHFVLLGETSTNEPNLIVSWQSDAPVMSSGGFAGKGLLLTDLNASELSSGTVPLARLGTNTASAGQVLTAVDGATEWADAAGGVTLEQVAAGGFLNVSNSEVILNSDTYMAWSTNGAITLTAETNNLGIVLSNGFAGASFQKFGPALFGAAWTVDGTNWATGITNVSVTVGMIKGMTELGNSDPAGVTNLTLLSWTEPSLFGKTNFTRSQILIVDRPKLADAAAPLRTVTNEAWRAVRNQTNWASIPAKSEVDLGGYGERLTAEWKRTATATTNADSLDWLWTGTNVWSVVGPPSVSVSRAEYSVVVSSLTNVLVTLPAAYTSSVPRVLFSHTAKSPAWSRLSSTATATNDTLEVAFTVPNADYGFFRIAIDDGTPSFGTLNGVLELTPRTIAATNSTTWGRGSGLVCVDGDYVYISVGTNAWKRATLEAW